MSVRAKLVKVVGFGHKRLGHGMRDMQQQATLLSRGLVPTEGRVGCLLKSVHGAHAALLVLDIIAGLVLDAIWRQAQLLIVEEHKNGRLFQLQIHTHNTGLGAFCRVRVAHLDVQNPKLLDGNGTSPRPRGIASSGADAHSQKLGVVQKAAMEGDGLARLQRARHTIGTHLLVVKVMADALIDEDETWGKRDYSSPMQSILPRRDANSKLILVQACLPGSGDTDSTNGCDRVDGEGIGTGRVSHGHAKLLVKGEEVPLGQALVARGEGEHAKAAVASWADGGKEKLGVGLGAIRLGSHAQLEVRVVDEPVGAIQHQVAAVSIGVGVFVAQTTAVYSIDEHPNGGTFSDPCQRHLQILGYGMSSGGADELRTRAPMHSAVFHFQADPEVQMGVCWVRTIVRLHCPPLDHSFPELLHVAVQNLIVKSVGKKIFEYQGRSNRDL
mmetsp:Transcript_4281/g.6573  ORF Transcript_4281/g.6573 Transcript_4281/m.6573 type:complete len:441 (-) Transcript_4281:5398-6720(-)